MEFVEGFFRETLTSAGVAELTAAAAERGAAAARASAPVDSGDYRDGIEVEQVRLRDRIAHRVVGNDGKTMFVESVTGNLARSLNAARG